VAQNLVLKRGGDSPEGYRNRLFCGLLWLSGPWTLPLWAATIHGACRGLWFCLFCFLLFFKKGIFPGYEGTPMAVPDTLPAAKIVKREQISR
jgi:hypothetical protein